MGAPLFSVLITVYNTEKYLRECLNSVASQLCTDFEAVITDDGSTDFSGRIADEYAKADSRFRVIHTENAGVLSARRTAAKNARGQYFIIIDSDDVLDTGLLLSVREQLLKTPCDMVFFDFSVFDSSGTIHTESYFPEPRFFGGEDMAELFGLLLTTRFNSLCIKCCTSRLLSLPIDYALFSGLSHSEDLLQSAYILCGIKSAAYINRPLYFYRAGVGVSSRFDSDSLLRSSLVTDVIARLMRENGFDTAENVRELKVMCRKILNNYIGLLAGSNLSSGERTGLLKIAGGTSLYARAMSRDCSPDFSRTQNLKFALLRRSMVRTALLLQTIKQGKAVR